MSDEANGCARANGANGANGTANGSANGDHGGSSEILPSGFRRDDLVRLLTQCIHGLGYHRAAESLEHDSGIRLLSAPMVSFRSGILEGDWDAVERIVGELQLAPPARASVRFLVARQKYMELLEAGKAPDALRCLREQLAPLEKDGAAPDSGRRRGRPSIAPRPSELDTDDDSARTALARRPRPPSAPSPPPASQLGASVQELSAYLMCTSAAELHEASGWDGARGESRRGLLAELQTHIPPTLLLPEDRLQTLLRQALLWQTNQCLHYAPSGLHGCSLLEDLSGASDDIPRETRRVLDKHDDEVWFVAFSHSGDLLASASKDRVVIVWDVRDADAPHKRLCGHTDALSYLAWSPDDRHILTCANDRTLKLWAVGTAECTRTYLKHSEAVTACAWLPSGDYFASAGIDKTIVLWSASSGEAVQTWAGPRATDLGIGCGGTKLVAICADRTIRLCSILYDNGAPRMLTSAVEAFSVGELITSLALSADSRHLLVNVASEEVHAWDLERRQLQHKYRGQRQGRFVIRSAFGGRGDAFVASGSEDSQVYIWHRHSTALLEVLPGHSGSVNAVAWNPRDPRMFASASDDHTVRIWGCGCAR